MALYWSFRQSQVNLGYSLGFNLRGMHCYCNFSNMMLKSNQESRFYLNFTNITPKLTSETLNIPIISKVNSIVL